jgi:IclR family transcriptional regulator, KDG regulon repressor
MKSFEVITIIPANKKTSVLQSVQNGLRILQLFTIEKPVWGLTEIAHALQIHKSTVSRLITDLLVEGFLQKEGHKYSLGFSLLSISGVITSHLEIHRESKDILKKLVSDLGESGHIAILEGKEITYVHKIECANPVPLLSSIGKKNPVTCTSAGKVLLAFQPTNRIDSLIAEGLPRLGPNSITDPEQLKWQLSQITEQGYSICIDEMHENVVSMAAPVRDYTSEVIAAVSVVGTRERIHHTKINSYTERIILAANEVSMRLGFIPDKEWTIH